MALKDFYEGQRSKEQSSIKEYYDDENDSMLQWLDNEDDFDQWANIFDNTEKRLDTKFEIFWEFVSHAKGDIKEEDDENDSQLQCIHDEEEVDRWVMFFSADEVIVEEGKQSTRNNNVPIYDDNNVMWSENDFLLFLKRLFKDEVFLQYFARFWFFPLI